MFTWVCPTCGHEWEVSVEQCPNCAVQPAQQAAPRRTSSGLAFWILLVLGAGAGVAGLVFWVRYQPSRPASAQGVETKGAAASKSAPTLEPVPETPAEAAPAGPIEVAGLRASYDSQNRPQIRAVVINHGADPLAAAFTVTLRAMESAADAPPLARFSVRLSPEIKPGESREIRAPLETLVTLAALPPWRRLRIEVDAR